MKIKPLKRAPVILAIFVLALICGVRLLWVDFFERLERMTYDLRAKTALHFSAPVATNLAFVAIADSSIIAVQNGTLGFHFGLAWPRQVYGRLVEELSGQNVKAVAFDVQFEELRPDHPPVQMADGSLIESDDFLALQMRRATNVILATTSDAPLPDLFATNALAPGDISTEKDSDGVLREVKAFHIYRNWHPLFKKAADDYGLDLANAKFAPGKIVLPQTGTTNTVEVPVDAENNFSLADFGVNKLPTGVAPTAKAFTDERVWQMGIVLAAQELKLDLQNAEIDLPRDKIILRGANGIERTIPVDANGSFYIDWRLKPNDPHLLQAPIESLLWQDKQRLGGETNGLTDAFRGKLVIVGSTAQGNNLTDRGATPLEKDTFLVSKHWNIANSVITGQFIRRASLPLEIALIIFLGTLTAFLTWQLRAFTASLATFLLMLIYAAIAFLAFVEFRFWLPLVFPIAGAMLVEHIGLVTYRVVFEEREQRRIRSVFSKVVAPDVVNELLGASKLSLGGARREMTMFFADVRGFTRLTDEMQERAADFVRDNKLDEKEAEIVFDLSAREMLNTVNLYLALVADTIIAHGGTLDKYIGDCVMAFWGAPTPHKTHATACVRAAIEVQRAIRELNKKRIAENAARDFENLTRAASGLPPKPSLRALQLGTGINTGLVTAGLMGSEQHQYNYTVFGHEVNLASRLEGVSGSGRIIISEATYTHLLRDDPGLAATCIGLPPVKVKGIHAEVKIYEVPWRPSGASPFDDTDFTVAPGEGTSFTGILQRESN
ncbi:MAG TPA: adenylate/guanylate cyclase domain-containing protein [Verrucomicrobiae bacterium]|nr:adenylate/guanylate cyclase domain-containing protein [Verrucomicrobiae bacterium]